MKKLVIAFATLALLFACSSKENNPGNEDQNGQNQEQGHDYTNTDNLVFVDMGTKVLWATMNLGASHSTEFGSYMEWSPLTVSDEEGFSDCRMPTKADYEELATVKTADGKYTDGPCRVKWGKVNGVYGLTYTNKKTGNAIFMPAGGYYAQGYPLYVGQMVWNWTLDSKQGNYGLQATSTKFQEGAAPYAGAFWEPFVATDRCTVRLVKEK